MDLLVTFLRVALLLDVILEWHFLDIPRCDKIALGECRHLPSR